jgi:hypothetical protein
MKKLPYRARTETGDVFEFEFPLHAETGSPMRVDQLLSAILAAVDRDLSLTGDTSNGDVLQALAMALATRTRMIHTEPATAAHLTRSLLETALEAAEDAERRSPQSGSA